MNHFEDRELLQLLKNSDVKAYEFLFKKYYKLLSMKAFFILDDEMEAEDTIQSLFSEIWEKKLYLRIDTSLKAYLYTAVRNRCFKLLEKKKVKQSRLDEYVYHNTFYDEYDICEEIETRDMEIERLLKELAPQRQRAFVLVYLEDKKYKEAAFEMGVTVNSIKTHLKLAVAEFKKRLITFR